MTTIILQGEIALGRFMNRILIILKGKVISLGLGLFPWEKIIGNLSELSPASRFHDHSARDQSRKSDQILFGCKKIQKSFPSS